MLVRMINSIFRYSPAHLLAEIVLYDDFSEQHMQIEERLKEYAKLKDGQWAELVKFHRAQERQGLIRAKASKDPLLFSPMIGPQGVGIPSGHWRRACLSGLSL